MGTRENKFHKFREIVQTQVKSVHSTSTVFHMNYVICFRHLMVLEMILFEKLFKTGARKFAKRSK